MEKTESQNKQPPPPPEQDSVATAPPTVTLQRNNGDHVSLFSPVVSPLKSPEDSHSYPLHSIPNSVEHISISSPVVSAGNSPPRSSLAFEHITFNHSRGSSSGNDKLQSSENEKPQSLEMGPPAVVVSNDVFKESMENTVVIQESTAVVNMAVLEESKAVVVKTDSSSEAVGGGGSAQRRFRPSLSISSRAERKKMVRKAALGFRVFGLLLCLASFSVMEADRNQGWALDSFYHYKEFRYCMSVNVIGFVYSGAQALDLLYNLATGKNVVRHQQLRCYFDFAVDQLIAYLLISASSSATIRIVDWQANWGKDMFPNMATASVSTSFLAFVALAASSLISGYSLFTSKSV